MLAGGPIGFAAVLEYQDMGYDTFPSQAVVDGLYGVPDMFKVVVLEIDKPLVLN